MLLESTMRGVVIATLLALPMTALAVDPPKAPPKSALKPIIHTEQFDCFASPAVCNCNGAANCKVLEASGNCKEGTYTFHENENLGTCILKPAT